MKIGKRHLLYFFCVLNFLPQDKKQINTLVIILYILTQKNYLKRDNMVLQEQNFVRLFNRAFLKMILLLKKHIITRALRPQNYLMKMQYPYQKHTLFVTQKIYIMLVFLLKQEIISFRKKTLKMRHFGTKKRGQMSLKMIAKMSYCLSMVIRLIN